MVHSWAKGLGQKHARVTASSKIFYQPAACCVFFWNWVTAATTFDSFLSIGPTDLVSQVCPCIKFSVSFHMIAFLACVLVWNERFCF